jgi:hypothetical protein
MKTAPKRFIFTPLAATDGIYTMRWSLWARRRWLCPLLLILLTFLPVPILPVPILAAQSPAPTTDHFLGIVTFRNERLTVRVTAVPLRQVMGEISRLSGAQLRWLSPAGEELTSVEFTALPIADALRRLLGGKNFLLFYTALGAKAKLTQIRISASGSTGTSPGLTASPVPLGQPALPSGGLLAPQNKEAASAEPAELEAPPLETLLQVARLDQDPAVRVGAIAQLAGYAQDDSRVQVILSQVAQSDSNPRVQEAAAELLQNLQ